VNGVVPNWPRHEHFTNGAGQPLEVGQVHGSGLLIDRVAGVVVAPDDVPEDHAGLLRVAGVVGAVEREVPQGGELGLAIRADDG
jgi:hypothetical protein